MKLEQSRLNCQIPCLKHISTGPAVIPQESVIRQMKLEVRRRLNPSKERALKNYSNKRLNQFCMLIGKQTKPSAAPRQSLENELRAGDLVRVRTLEEIEQSLNHWNQVKGCGFMAEMAKYCGTTQRVLKPMKSFVDERDLLVKRSNGIILLENVICEGTEDFGTCDRSCFHFWREEWLEKITEPSNSTHNVKPSDKNFLGKVRVRSLKEIKKTLDKSSQLEGVPFFPEMSNYCETTQIILKKLNRFVDEHDLRVKNTKDIMLLHNVMCSWRRRFKPM